MEIELSREYNSERLVNPTKIKSPSSIQVAEQCFDSTDGAMTQTYSIFSCKKYYFQLVLGFSRNDIIFLLLFEFCL